MHIWKYKYYIIILSSYFFIHDILFISHHIYTLCTISGKTYDLQLFYVQNHLLFYMGYSFPFLHTCTFALCTFHCVLLITYFIIIYYNNIIIYNIYNIYIYYFIGNTLYILPLLYRSSFIYSAPPLYIGYKIIYIIYIVIC